MGISEASWWASYADLVSSWSMKGSVSKSKVHSSSEKTDKNVLYPPTPPPRNMCTCSHIHVHLPTQEHTYTPKKGLNAGLSVAGFMFSFTERTHS